MKRLFLILVVVASLVISSTLLASGFFIQHQDAKAQGQGGAFTAQADNPSAVWYNPAGMSQLDGTQISVSSSFLKIESEYTNTLGVSEDMEDEWAVLPRFYITSDLKTEKWTVGLGVNSPFGLATGWSETGILRYAATDTSVKLMNFNPAVSYQLLDELSVAAGVSYSLLMSYLSEVKSNMILGDANIKMETDGDGWGFNVAALWKPHEKHSFGVSYRSRIDVDLDGDLVYSDIPAGLGLPSQIAYDISSEITIPSIVNAGYAIKPIDKLKLEVDLYWVEFATIDKIDLTDKATDILLSSTQKDWDSTVLVAVGAEYLVRDNVTARCGYIYGQSAVPEKTFSPELPDSDLHCITLGLGLDLSGMVIDLTYELGLYENRDVQNAVGQAVGTSINGEYDTYYHNFGIGATVKF